MVSFQPSEDQQLIRDTVAAFAQEQVRPHAHDADETGTVPSAIIQQGWDLGLVQSAIPEAYGGAGDTRSVVTGALIAEELAWGDLSIALHLLAPRLVLYPVLEMGTDEQKQRILTPYASTQFRAGSAAVMEPRFDFDLSALTATARRDNGAYVVNGAKCYVPLGDDAEHLLVYARTDDREGYESVGGFLVEKGATGVQVAEREKNMGIKALATHEIGFDNCRVPAANRLGGDAGCDFAKLMNYSRVGLAAMAVGVARAAFEYARDYAKDRKAFGVAIGQKQAIAFMLAEMALEIDATRLLAWEAAWKMDRGEDATREAYLAKNYAANMVLKVTDNAVQILGGHGYIREHPVELWLRNGRGFATFEGLVMV
jgi:alkylation response protein AidB-like acyl-CoA dehydrogenase